MTKAVEAIWKLLVPTAAVGAVGVPVKVGEADRTVLPVPVEVVTPVPPLVTGTVATVPSKPAEVFVTMPATVKAESVMFEAVTAPAESTLKIGVVLAFG